MVLCVCVCVYGVCMNGRCVWCVRACMWFVYIWCVVCVLCVHKRTCVVSMCACVWCVFVCVVFVRTHVCGVCVEVKCVHGFHLYSIFKSTNIALFFLVFRFNGISSGGI